MTAQSNVKRKNIHCQPSKNKKFSLRDVAIPVSATRGSLTVSARSLLPSYKTNLYLLLELVKSFHFYELQSANSSDPHPPHLPLYSIFIARLRTDGLRPMLLLYILSFCRGGEAQMSQKWLFASFMKRSLGAVLVLYGAVTCYRSVTDLHNVTYIKCSMIRCLRRTLNLKFVIYKAVMIHI